MKHTKGPWKIAPINDNDGNLTHFITSVPDDTIITYALPNTMHPEMMANAKLLAAAPELLYELKELMQDFYNCCGSSILDLPAYKKAFRTILKLEEEDTKC